MAQILTHDYYHPKASHETGHQFPVKKCFWATLLVMVKVYSPLKLVTWKSVKIPWISYGNIATESVFNSENIRKIMVRNWDSEEIQ